MASPQIENGHLDIANTIVDKLCSYRLSGQEWQIVWVVLRKTWGWLEDVNNKNGLKKKMDRIALSQFETLTGIDRRKCHILLKKLIDKKVIKKTVTQKGDKQHISYGFQKDFELWKLSPKKVTVTQKEDGVSPKKVSKLSPKKVNTKEKKETITKETFLSDSFECRLAEYLFNHILKNNPKHKPVNIQSWAKSIDLMLRIDKREVEEIKQVIRWCQQDEFWRTNILSASKLREQYDALILKMNNKKGEPQTIIKQYINEATDVMG